MTWSQLDVEAAIMLLTAAAIAYSAMQFIFLRGRHRLTELVRKQGQALRRAGARSIGKEYGPGLGVAALLAALIVSVPSHLSSGIALSILVGAVGAFLLMLLAVVACVGTFLSVTHDLEGERPIRARSEPVVAASAFGCAILAGVFGMLLAVYLASNGNVTDLVGVAVGASLISLSALTLRALRPTGPVPSSPPTRDPVGSFSAALSEGALLSSDLLASLLVGAGAAALFAYRDSVPRDLFSNGILFPLLVGAWGVVAAIVGTAIASNSRPGPTPGSLYLGLLVAVFVAVLGQAVLVILVMSSNFGVFLAGLSGTAAGFVAMAAYLLPWASRSEGSSGDLGPRGERVPEVATATRWSGRASAALAFGAVTLGSIGAYAAVGWGSGPTDLAGVGLDFNLFGLVIAGAAMVGFAGPALMLGGVAMTCGSTAAVAGAATSSTISSELGDFFHRSAVAARAAAFGLAPVIAAITALGLLASYVVVLADAESITVVSLATQLAVNDPFVFFGLMTGALGAIVLDWILFTDVRKVEIARSAGHGEAIAWRSTRALVPVAILTVGVLALGLGFGALAVIGFMVGFLLAGLPLALRGRDGTISGHEARADGPGGDGPSDVAPDRLRITFAAILRLTVLGGLTIVLLVGTFHFVGGS
jgi:K(+)-stimulated pyrophosphate-energized sodium pump